MDWQTIGFIAAATIVLLLIARLVTQFLMHEKMTEALIKRDNAAVGIALAGYLFGVMMIITDVLSGPGHGDWAHDAIGVAIYGIGGIVFLAFVAMVELKLILSKTALQAVHDGNIAAGIVTAGSFISTSLVIASNVSGEGSGGNYLTPVIFFLVGQATLLAVTYLFRLLTAYDDAKEIMNGNIAAALSYAGVMIAVAIIVSDAIRGNFTDYESSLKDFGKTMLVVLTLYPIRQFLVQGMLLGAGFRIYGGQLDDEISRDRNLSSAAIESMMYIATALLAVRMI
jgi:uncharacterized membrane protein YjfL (UPF0719 family)